MFTFINFGPCGAQVEKDREGIKYGERQKNAIWAASALFTEYNIARVLALYKSYWAAMNKIFIYPRTCVNLKIFFHDDVPAVFLYLFSKVTSAPKSMAMMKTFYIFTGIYWASGHSNQQQKL